MREKGRQQGDKEKQDVMVKQAELGGGQREMGMRGERVCKRKEKEGKLGKK